VSARFQPGDRLGDLVIERELGHGAFAVVYLAQDTFLDRQVALKVLAATSLSRNDQERAKLLDEARTVARLRSPHIVPLHRVHDLGAGGLALEMEYMEGGSLAALLDGRPVLPPDEAVAYLRSVLAALDAAHSQQVVHCDVKPENVLLTARGEARLADFGLGRRISEASLSAEHAKLQGTPLYMSPEVVAGERATAASDLWSAGVLLYCMLAGRLPFAARSLPALFYAIHHEAPDPLGEGHPPLLAALTERCLAKDPALRPASAAAILRELAGGSGGERPAARAAPVAAVPAGPAPIGREAEIETLAAVLASAEQGHGSAALLLGEAGVGKSTLLRETARRAGERGFRWIEATVTPLGGLQRPLVTAARRLLLSESASGLAGQVTSTRFGAAAVVLRGLLTEDAFDLQGRQQFVWAVEHLLRGLSLEHPVALAVEDLHLADGEDLRALAEVVRRLADARVAVLAAVRTNDPTSSQGLATSAPALQELSAVPGLVSVPVGPLAEESLRCLVLRESGAERVAPEALERIREQSEGNALFALELVRHLLADGALDLRAKRLVPGPRWSETELPQRLADLVSVRLQRLTPDQREVLDAAAVDGVTFDGTVLAAVLDGNLLKTLRALQRITREHGLLLPQRQGFRFAHAMFRDVIYRELSPDLRRSYHRALAVQLEAAGAGRTDPERLGMHWHHAGEPANAAPHLRAAALAAARRQDYTRAIRLATSSGILRKGLSTAEVVREAELIFALIGCFSDRGENARIAPLLDALHEAATVERDAVLLHRTTCWRADVGYHAEGPAIHALPALAAAAEGLRGTADGGRAFHLLGFAARTRGDVKLAEHWFREADASFERAGMSHLRAQVQFALGVLARRNGHLDASIAHFVVSARNHRAVGRETDAAIAEVLRCAAAQSKGMLAGLEGPLRAAVATLERTGAEARAAHASVYLARWLIASGRLREAGAMLAQAVSVLEAHRNFGGLLEAAAQYSDVLITMGELNAAAPLLTLGERLAAANKDDVEASSLMAPLQFRFACSRQEWDRLASGATAMRDAAVRLGDVEYSQLAALTVTEGIVLAGFAPATDLSSMLDMADELAGSTQPIQEFVGAVRCLGSDSPDAGAIRAGAKALATAPPGVRQAEWNLLAGLVSAWPLNGNEHEVTPALSAVIGSATTLPFPLLERRARSLAMDLT
jgi:tRNA A-37 threonylcarbamoyl transferase component Bud32